MDTMELLHYPSRIGSRFESSPLHSPNASLTALPLSPNTTSSIPAIPSRTYMLPSSSTHALQHFAQPAPTPPHLPHTHHRHRFHFLHFHRPTRPSIRYTFTRRLLRALSFLGMLATWFSACANDVGYPVAVTTQAASFLMILDAILGVAVTVYTVTVLCCRALGRGRREPVDQWERRTRARLAAQGVVLDVESGSGSGNGTMGQQGQGQAQNGASSDARTGRQATDGANANANATTISRAGGGGGGGRTDDDARQLRAATARRRVERERRVREEMAAHDMVFSVEEKCFWSAVWALLIVVFFVALAVEAAVAGGIGQDDG